MMTNRWPALVAAVLLAAVRPGSLAAQTEKGPYARIAILRPHNGDTVDFEAGYLRHLEFHRQAKDTWGWYGWSIWAGDRQRWFVYATFGHSAASLDNPVPAERLLGKAEEFTVDRAVDRYLALLQPGVR